MEKKMIWLWLLAAAVLALPACSAGGEKQKKDPEMTTLVYAALSEEGVHRSAVDRFYRHVLIAKRYPHHGAVAFGHWGKALFEVFKYLGIQDIAYNQPASLPYPGENLFK